MKRINWLAPHVKLHTDEREGLPDVITPQYGVGLSFKDENGKNYTTVLDKDGRRRISVQVHSWVGVSFGAVHYYGKITVYDLELEYMEDGKKTTSSIGGYFDRFKPKDAMGFDLSVKRRLTDNELTNGTRYDTERFRGYKADDLVEAFDDELELYNAIVSVIKARFAGDWLVEISGFDTEKYNTYNGVTIAKLLHKRKSK
jgi:hypothetical protein